MHHEALFFVSLATASVCIIANIALGETFCERLQSHHTELYAALGKPGLFNGSDKLMNLRRAMRGLVFASPIDPVLRRLSRLTKASGYLAQLFGFATVYFGLLEPVFHTIKERME